MRNQVGTWLMATRAILAVGMFAVLVLWAPLRCDAQEASETIAEVTLAEGTAEVRLPDVGWRRAVLGRRLPADSVVATWLDSRVVVSRGETFAEIGPVSHIAVLPPKDDLLRLRFDAGSMTVTTDKGVLLELAESRLHLRSEVPGQFSLTTRELVVSAGSVILEVPGLGAATVPTGGRVSLVPHDLQPIFLLRPR